LLTPYYHSTGNPLIVVPLFLATLTLTGVVYGELRLMTGSVWPATLAHGAGNSGVAIIGRFWREVLEVPEAEQARIPNCPAGLLQDFALQRLQQRLTRLATPTRQNMTTTTVVLIEIWLQEAVGWQSFLIIPQLPNR